MFYKLVRPIFILCVVLISVTIIGSAQDTCSEIVDIALTAVEDFCSETDRNQVCFGNIQIEVEQQTEQDDLVFDAPGDRINVATIQTLRLSPMNVDKSIWGIAVMSLQPNLPDTAPGQNVEIFMYGDVEIQNRAETDPDDADTESGEAQSFYFRTGIGDAICVDSPHSGIKIQTPEGMGEITLSLNEVNISLGSTAYLQAQAGGDMRVNVIEGQARVEAFGEEQIAVTNMRIDVPLGEDLTSTGPPNPPQMCDLNDLQGLKLGPQNDCNTVHINPRWQVCPPIIPFGMRLGVHFEELDYETEAAALVAMEAAYSTIEINGESMPVTRSGPNDIDGLFWEYVTEYNGGRLTPGSYTIVARNLDGTFTCTFEVLSP
jgi:hypothetical protein